MNTANIKGILKNNKLIMNIISFFINHPPRWLCFNKIKKTGKNNLCLFNGCMLIKSKILFKGSNNKITADKFSFFRSGSIKIFGNNNTIRIGKNVKLHGVEFWIEDDNNEIIINENTVFAGKAYLSCIEGTKITIGKGCLFSSNVHFRTGDSHSILDKNNNRINYSENITVENHVWIGNSVIILKGAYIKSDSVVATGAVVTSKDFENNVIIGGVHAKIIKKDVNWDTKRL